MNRFKMTDIPNGRLATMRKNVLVAFFLLACLIQCYASDYITGTKYLDNKQYLKAIEHLTKAAEEGSLGAQKTLANIYYGIEDVPVQYRDYGKALKWYLAAADKDDFISQCILGRMYELGKGVNQDTKEAKKWYKEAKYSRTAYHEARLLGEKYEALKGESNKEESMFWYRFAAENGDERALNYLGDYFYNRKNYPEAIIWFEKAAGQRYVYSSYRLGSMYELGTGVEKDSLKAVKYYSKVSNKAKKDTPSVLRNLGDKYLKDKDYENAAFWFRKASELGDAYSRYTLGVMYVDGQGVKKDIDEAARFFYLATTQGYSYGKAREAYEAVLQQGAKKPVDLIEKEKKRTEPGALKKIMEFIWAKYFWYSLGAMFLWFFLLYPYFKIDGKLRTKNIKMWGFLPLVFLLCGTLLAFTNGYYTPSMDTFVEILFFLAASYGIVQICLTSKSKKSMAWRIALFTFISAFSFFSGIGSAYIITFLVAIEIFFLLFLKTPLLSRLLFNVRSSVPDSATIKYGGGHKEDARVEQGMMGETDYTGNKTGNTFTKL